MKNKLIGYMMISPLIILVTYLTYIDQTTRAIVVFFAMCGLCGMFAKGLEILRSSKGKTDE